MFVNLGPKKKWTFTNCKKIGRSGPNQQDADNEYLNSNVNVKIIGEGIQKWVVPETGLYKIDAQGAAGVSTCDRYTPGRGALISSLLKLFENDTLYILVGQTPEAKTINWGGGGGGATFVAKYDPFSKDILLPGSDEKANISLLIAAAGGGGSGDCDSNNNHKNGEDGSADNAEEGCGKSDSNVQLSGGAGYKTDSQYLTYSFLNGNLGGYAIEYNVIGEGGFGGGGAPWNAGGGGGGYKGGDSGYETNGDERSTGGKGGFSFCSEHALKLKSGYNKGSGIVRIYLMKNASFSCKLSYNRVSMLSISINILLSL